MVGIYIITNDKTGMSYVGQSVHCGKRLDEHCRGDQYIDKVIQTDGIENFTFKILKQVNKSELSAWEDYYIMKYNTMSPNGYNMRWNCSEELREILCSNLILNRDTKEDVAPQPRQKEEDIPVYKPILDKEQYLQERLQQQEQKIEHELLKEQEEPEFIPPLTVKHWEVYYYLLGDSSYAKDYKSVIDKRDVDIAQMARALSMAPSTAYAGIERLKKNGYIKEDSNTYIIYLTDTKNLRYRDFRDKVSYRITNELNWLDCYLRFDNPEKSDLFQEKIERAQEKCYGLLDNNTKLGKELIDYGRDLLEYTNSEFEFEKLL